MRILHCCPLFHRRFEEFEALDFARVGSLATETVELPEGPLEQFTHDMEPFLRKQGLPVRLNRGQCHGHQPILQLEPGINMANLSEIQSLQDVAGCCAACLRSLSSLGSQCHRLVPLWASGACQDCSNPAGASTFQCNVVASLRRQVEGQKAVSLGIRVQNLMSVVWQHLGRRILARRGG